MARDRCALLTDTSYGGTGGQLNTVAASTSGPIMLIFTASKGHPDSDEVERGTVRAEEQPDTANWWTLFRESGCVMLGFAPKTQIRCGTAFDVTGSPERPNEPLLKWAALNLGSSGSFVRRSFLESRLASAPCGDRVEHWATADGRE